MGDQHLIRLLAKAVYHVAGKRPVDPNWENRGRNVQQYELRVRRLDERFDARLKELFAKAMAADKWQGTSAVHDPVAYWAVGVLAYFDALGQDDAPNDAAHPIATRELLKEYDPELFAVVHETMAYQGKVDWRFVTCGSLSTTLQFAIPVLQFAIDRGSDCKLQSRNCKVQIGPDHPECWTCPPFEQRYSNTPNSVARASSSRTSSSGTV